MCGWEAKESGNGETGQVDVFLLWSRKTDVLEYCVECWVRL